jgi:hypothetical protein
MHEPDEQNLRARVLGTVVLNSDRNPECTLNPIALEQGYHEMIVVLDRETSLGRFNLADLLALARKAEIDPDNLPFHKADKLRDDIARITEYLSEDLVLNEFEGEEELKASIVGTSFDNAFGHSVLREPIEQGFQEIVVCLNRYIVNTGLNHVQVNLASLIALARLANI